MIKQLTCFTNIIRPCILA